MIYTDLPADWQTLIEQTAFTRLYLQLVFDPDGRNVVLSGENGIESFTPITSNLEMDINYERRPNLNDITITLKDPYGTLDPKNNQSPFYNGISYLYAAGDNTAYTVQVEHNENVEYRAGQIVTLKGPAPNSDQSVLNERDLTVTEFTSGVSYDTITFSEALGRNYSIGSIIYVCNYKEEIILQILGDGATAPITLFRGNLTKEPEAIKGFIKLIVTDFKKEMFDQKLVGADSDSTNKIKMIDSTGTLVDSVTWNDLVYPTLNRAAIYPLADCPLGQWTATFTSSTTYSMDGPGLNNVSCEKTIGNIARMWLFHIEDYALDITKSGAYVYIPVLYSNKLAIIDTTSKTNPTIVGNIAIGTNPKFASVTISGNYVYMPFLDGGVGYVKVINVSNKAAPLLWDTKTAGSESVPSDFTPTGKCMISGVYLYVIEGNNVSVFSIGDPSNIAFVSRFGGAGSPNYCGELWSGVISGNYLYTYSTTDERLVVIDISVPAALSLVTTLEISGGGTGSGGGITLSGNYVYIATHTQVISVDISTPATPVVADTFGNAGTPFYTGGYQLIISGSSLFCPNPNYDSIAIIDITDPTNLKLIDEIHGVDEPTYLNEPFCCYAEADYLYIPVGGYMLIRKWSSTYSNKQGGDYLRIATTAWGGTMTAGDICTFFAGISWEAENPVQIIYELLTKNAELSTMLINSSSYFGEKIIGTLYETLSPGDTTVKIAVSVPQLIKDGETIIISLTEIAIVTGNTVQTSYPPYIELTIGAYGGAEKAKGTKVSWKQAVAIDTDYNFDAIYDYCDTNGIAVSITLERDMSVLEAIETIGAHMDGFIFTDNWGVENIYAFREPSGIPIEVTSDTNLLIPDPSYVNKEYVNELTLKYGFDYNSNKYYYEKVYQGENGLNSGIWRFGTKLTCELIMPGFYDENLADFIAVNKTKVWENGVKLLQFNMSIEGLVLQIGDLIHVESLYPAVDANFEIIGKSYEYSNGLTCKFLAYELTGVWT